MSFTRWLRTWKRTVAAGYPLHAPRSSLRLESLEDRLAPAAVITVNSVLDSNTRDDVLTLREGILVNNRTLAVGTLTATEQAQVSGTPTNIDTDTIQFVIGSGLQTISPTTGLPTITDAVVIDGTAPSAFPTQQIELNGAGAGTVSGLTITVGNSTVRGLTINRFGVAGIDLNGGGGNHIEGNIIGLDPTGTIARGNANSGVRVNSSDDNVIGGLEPGQGNVLSGNTANGAAGIRFQSTGTNLSERNQVLGNRIGTNAAGTAAVGNFHGVLLIGQSNNVIGGNTAAARNIISGNAANGINMSTGSSHVIIGNYIGTDVTGTIDLGNANNGMFLTGGTNHRIGGLESGEGNLISGNHATAITLSGALSAAQGNQILGNFIGTNASGTAALSTAGNNGQNAGFSAVLLGGPQDTFIAGNLISGNTAAGIGMSSGGAFGVSFMNVRIENNRIGTDASGTANVGNLGDGVHYLSTLLRGGTIGGTSAGTGNIIAFNRAGVNLPANDTNGVAILGNSIFANRSLGINLGNDLDFSALSGVTLNDAGDADTGANGFQNYPVLTSASSGVIGTTIEGTFNSIANRTYRLEFFANTALDPTGYGEGQRYLGFTEVTTDASGNASFSVTFAVTVSNSEFVTATATDPNNNTSEFSQGRHTVLANSSPTANAGPDQTSVEGATVNFDGTGSTDPDGDALSYFWDFGDGASGSGATPTHTYSQTGTYVVTLTVEDGKGGSSSDTMTVTVNDEDTTGPTITLGGSSGTETDSQTQHFTWNVSDPSGLGAVSVTIRQNAVVIHTSDVASGDFNFDSFGLGDFDITVEATDADNDHTGDASTSTATRSVTVIDDDTTAPSIALSGSSGDENDGQNQQFGWDVSDVSGLSAVNVTVSKLGFGTIASFNTASGSYDFNSAGPGTYTLSVSATDNDTDWSDDQASSNATRPVVVSDDDTEAPTIALSGSQGNEDESQTQAFSWNVSDTSGLGSVSVVVTRNGETIHTSTSAPGGFNFDTFGPGVYVLTASATDADTDWTSDALSASATRTVTVSQSQGSEVTAAISGPATGVRGQEREFTFSASSSAGGTNFTYIINWGDGHVQHVNGGSSIALKHTFVGSELFLTSYAVKVLAVDLGSNTASAEVSHAIDILAWEVQTMSIGGRQEQVLVVGGTTGDDGIHLRETCYSDWIKVRIKERDFDVRLRGRVNGDIDRVIVYAQAGDDRVEVGYGIDVTAELHGGIGDDRLKGGRGHDILLGGAGCDTLIGGAGRDLLIGGIGQDRLRGEGADDILIAGSTIYDNHDAALRLLLGEWTSCSSYETRVHNLKHGGGENGSYVLNDSTVEDDGVRDVLTGDSGRDWFLFNRDGDGGKRDEVTDACSNENRTDIDIWS